MTRQEVIDIFNAHYLLECSKRQTKNIELQYSLLNLWIDEAVIDVQDRLKLYKNLVTISLTGAQSYALSLNGDFNRVTLKNVDNPNEIECIPIEEINLDTTDTGEPTSYALKTGSDGIQYIYFNTKPTTGTVYIWQYSYPALAISATVSTTVALPDKYLKSIYYYMLSKIFVDYYQLYNNEINSLKSRNQNSTITKPRYKFGGL